MFNKKNRIIAYLIAIVLFLGAMYCVFKSSGDIIGVFKLFDR